MVETRVAGVVVCQEVVVESGIGSAPDTSVAVIAFHVNRPTERLGDETVLECEIGIAVATDTLVGTPREGAMVDDDVLAPADSERISLHFARIAHTKTDKAHNHIATFDFHRLACYADTLPRSSLSRDGECSVGDIELALEMNRPRHIENHRACAREVDGMTQRACVVGVIGEAGYMEDYTSTPAGGILASALCSRESERLLRGNNRLFAPSARRAEKSEKQT